MDWGLMLFGAAYLLPLAVPALLAWRSHHSQTHLINRCRALFVLAVRALEIGESSAAAGHLRQIRKFEARWRWNQSSTAVARKVFTAALLTGILYSAAKLAAFSIVLHRGPGALEFLVFGGINALFGCFVAYGMRDFFRPEFEIVNFGDRLKEILRSTRSLAPTSSTERDAGNLDGLTARQVLGLGRYYTKSDIQRAWRKLASEFHPDRHVNASAEERAAMEAAFKRAALARDELLATVL